MTTLRDAPLLWEKETGKPCLEALVSTFPGLIYRCLNDLSWTTQYVSAGAFQMTEYHPEDLMGGRPNYSSLIHAEDRDRVYAEVQAAIDKRQSFQMSYRIVTASGKEKWVLEQGTGIYGIDDQLIALQGYVIDISHQKALEVALREKAALLDQAHDAIVVTRVDGRITYWNRGAERIFGWSAEEAVGCLMTDLSVVKPTQRRAAVRATLRRGDWRGEIEKRCKNGDAILVEAHYTLVRDEAGRPKSIFAIETNITERMAAQRQIETLVYYDPLTKLPNRHLLGERLKHALERAERSGIMGAVLFMDVRDFKSINDALGRQMGDVLLKQVADGLLASEGTGGTLARVGADEFALLLKDLSRDPDMVRRQVERVTERIFAFFNTPIRLDAHDHHVTFSIGVGVFGDVPASSDKVLTKAGVAMYQAKAEGHNTIRFFDPAMQANITSRLLLEADLRSGLENQDFFLHYQPQCDETGEVIAVEALVRWRRRGQHSVSPNDFVSMAEESGLIIPLGEWVLDAACRQLVRWALSPEKSRLAIAVNVSVRQFRHPQFIERLLRTVQRTGANPHKLKIELTESLLVHDLEETVAKMNRLKHCGIGLSLDDFGTGYSSLSYLRYLPLDQIKIDRSFVKNMLVSESDAAIVQTIIALGNSLHLQVIAEGVETEEQHRRLRQFGCCLYQGFLFGAPASPDAARAFHDSDNPDMNYRTQLPSPAAPNSPPIAEPKNS